MWAVLWLTTAAACDASHVAGVGDAAGSWGDGCTTPCELDTEPAGADAVVEAPMASGSGFGDPEHAINGVRGGGLRMQSLDVYSIPAGSHLVLEWTGRRIFDGPGVDFVVFENPFHFGDEHTFMDPTVVEVSADGEHWVALPHDYVAVDETTYSARQSDWIGFAGVRPVLLHQEHPVDGHERDGLPVDPFDAERAGGDPFDLADLPDADLRRRGVRYVRLSAATDHENPDTGAPFVSDRGSNGPDIDGVIARHLLEAQ